MPATPEKQIQKQILQYLAARGIIAIRVNSGAIKQQSPSGKDRYIRFNSMPGCSDIIAIAPKSGRFIAIEVKRTGGRMTPEQKDFLKRVADAGAYAVVCYSVDDLISFLNDIEGVTTP